MVVDTAKTSDADKNTTCRVVEGIAIKGNLAGMVYTGNIGDNLNHSFGF